MNWLRLWHFSSFSLSLTATLLALAACERHAEQREAVTALMGREIVIPPELKPQVKDAMIDCDLNDADYRIVTFVDSAGCVPCRMKLAQWEDYLNRLKDDPETDVSFLMILNAPYDDEIDYALKSAFFDHPVAIDTAGLFLQRNPLPPKRPCHTLLLDGSNRIVAIGNPVENPKVREVYDKVIFGDDARGSAPAELPVQMEFRRTKSAAPCQAGDTVTITYRFSNETGKVLTLQQTVTSCDCVGASLSADSLRPGEDATLTMHFTPEESGAYRQHADLYFNEIPNPMHFTMFGFTKPN